MIDIENYYVYLLGRQDRKNYSALAWDLFFLKEKRKKKPN